MITSQTLEGRLLIKCHKGNLCTGNKNVDRDGILSLAGICGKQEKLISPGSEFPVKVEGYVEKISSVAVFQEGNAQGVGDTESDFLVMRETEFRNRVPWGRKNQILRQGY